MMKKVLVICERSGIVREAFRARGHVACSLDLEQAEDCSPFHIRQDAREYLVSNAAGEYDLWIAHPDCTYLSVSGLHWNKRRPERLLLTDKAIAFVQFIFDRAKYYNMPLALENPISCISTRIRKPDQIIQPWQFGDDASKATCLWLDHLPLLELDPGKFFPPRRVEWPKGSGRIVSRWANQTDSGQNRLGPSEARAMDRARTYPGIANAFSEQWGG